jgi:FkbM family methyltransferase
MKRAIKRSLAVLGLEVHRAGASVGPNYGLNKFFPLLQRLDFVPNHIIDVGANRGHWTRTAFEYFPDALYTLVEPQNQLKSFVDDLIERGCTLNWINAGCGARPGNLPLVVSDRDDSSTFVLVDRHGQSTGSRRVTVPIMTLNQIVAAGAAHPEMVKIDAEGFDLEVLEGASNLLGKTDVFLVEAVVCANYDNTVARVVGLMAKAGYSLMDITDINRNRQGALWLCELAFVRDGSPLLSRIGSYEAD